MQGRVVSLTGEFQARGEVCRVAGLQVVVRTLRVKSEVEEMGRILNNIVASRTVKMGSDSWASPAHCGLEVGRAQFFF